MQWAIGALSAFYKNNKVALVSSREHAAPKYSTDPNAAPETSWSGDKYGGRKSETTNILAMLGMLVEDAQKEIKEGKADDADAQVEYKKQMDALQQTLDAQQATKVSTEKELADLDEKIDANARVKKGKSDDKDAQLDTKKAIAKDCDWIETNLKSRRSKRKEEIQGLVDAKAFLAGGGGGLSPVDELK